MNGKVTLITQSEYARRRGVAKSAVAKAVAEGRISLIDGKIDPAVADIQWSQNTRARADSGRSAAPSTMAEGQASLTPTEGDVGVSRAPAPPAAPAEPGYADFRARRERADAERAERENAREAGKLVDRDLTERAIFDAFRQLRDAVIAVAPRASPKVIGLGDARDIELVIVGELRKAFEGWETQMLERLPAKEGT
ncbi:hypothetical protein BH11PSE13_BH11PSE13_12320 [soil metagenome]